MKPIDAKSVRLKFGKELAKIGRTYDYRKIDDGGYLVEDELYPLLEQIDEAREAGQVHESLLALEGIVTEMLDQYDVIEGVCGDFTDIYTEIATLWTACLRSDKLSDSERQDWLTKLEAIAKENKYGGTIEGIEPALDVYRMDMEAMTLMIGYKG